MFFWLVKNKQLSRWDLRSPNSMIMSYKVQNDVEAASIGGSTGLNRFESKLFRVFLK